MELAFDDVETLALAKAIKEKALKDARKNLTVGTHNVDVTAHISGTITVGADEEFIPTVCVPLKAAMALFIRYCGITRNAAETALVKAMTEALNNAQRGAETVDTVAGAISEEESIIAACEAQVTKMMGALPKQTRSGKVTTKLTVAPVEVAA